MENIENNIRANIEASLKPIRIKHDEHVNMAQNRYDEYVKFINDYNKVRSLSFYPLLNIPYTRISFLTKYGYN